MIKTASASSGIQSGFGFTAAAPEARTGMVREVFTSVAGKYDVMNDLMSLGVHRLWKADFVRAVAPQAEEAILDLAGGTGDIAFRMLRACKGGAPQVTVCDLTAEMLRMGEARATDAGFFGKIAWVEGNAEALPFADASFDAVTIAFGLRNVTRLGQALREVVRVLKPGGRFYCLEFSQVAVPLLQKLYDRYSFNVLPWLGGQVAGDRASYQYLAESIRVFPDQKALAKLMEAAGMVAVRHRNLSLGVAAVHSGWKA